MDISKQLHAYEVEYHVLQDEMVDAGPLSDDSERLDRIEKTNVQLKKQNMDLLEKLQVRKSWSTFSIALTEEPASLLLCCPTDLCHISVN